jgi:hypothetical protein
MRLKYLDAPIGVTPIMQVKSTTCVPQEQSALEDSLDEMLTPNTVRQPNLG